MPEEHEEEIRKKIYKFILDRGYENKKTFLGNVRIYAKKHDIKSKEMGYALKQLKDKGAIILGKKEGYLVR